MMQHFWHYFEHRERLGTLMDIFFQNILLSTDEISWTFLCSV